MAVERVICGAFLLCFGILQTSAQQISATRLEGQVGEFVRFTCTSTELGEAVNNALEIYDPALNDFVRAEDSPQVNRTNDPVDMSNTNYVYGPLTSADNNRILRCFSGMVTPNATISVTFPPTITGVTVGPIDEGMNLNVPLTVMGNPVPNYIWTRDGRPVTTENNITVSLTSIMFRPVNREDSGVYRIVATNSVGSASFNFTLNVQYPSQFQSEFVVPSDFNCVKQNAMMFQCAANLMEAVTFLCSALGNPASTVTIEHTSNAQPDITGSTVSIASVTSQNAGTYTCTARNQGFAPVQRVFRLYVGGIPVPVSQVNVEITGGMIVFNWTYNNSVNGVPATEYVITITPMGSNLITATETIPISQMSYTISISLEEFLLFRNHTVSLVVRNMQGTSEVISNRFVTPPGNGSVGKFVSLTVLALMLFLTSALLH